MAAVRRTRLDPRREATRIALIEAAESLFAEAGVDAVSTRQIGTAIGSLNTNVIAYHFGSKEALIEAIYRHRLPEIDRKRGELLEEADRLGNPPTMLDLMRVFALPLFEQVDTQGRHSYALFIGGIERSGSHALRGALIPEFPETDQLNQRMAELLEPMDQRQFHRRMRLAAGLVVAALRIVDRDASDQPRQAAKMFEDAVAMAAAAMAAGTNHQNWGIAR